MPLRGRGGAAGDELASLREWRIVTGLSIGGKLCVCPGLAARPVAFAYMYISRVARRGVSG